MTRYRLPDALGGGELVAHHTQYEAPVGTVAFIIDGCLVCVARGLLNEVKPPLPPEPPVGSVVLVGADPAHDARSGLVSGLVFRRYGAGWSAPGDDDGEFASWAEVCDGGTPVLLVPDPLAEAPDVPFSIQVGPNSFTHVTFTSDGEVEDTNRAVGHYAVGVRLKPASARAKGLALLRAAAQQEAND